MPYPRVEHDTDFDRLCRRLELSHAEIARRLGVAVVTLYRWRRGLTRPSPLAGRVLEQLEVWERERPERERERRPA